MCIQLFHVFSRIAYLEIGEKETKEQQTKERNKRGRKRGVWKAKESVGYEAMGNCKEIVYLSAQIVVRSEKTAETALPICSKEVIRVRISFPAGGGEGEEIPVRNPIRIGMAREGCRRHSSGKLREIREYSCHLYRRIRTVVLSLSVTNARAESYIRTRARLTRKEAI